MFMVNLLFVFESKFVFSLVNKMCKSLLDYYLNSFLSSVMLIYIMFVSWLVMVDKIKAARSFLYSVEIVQSMVTLFVF